MSSAPIAELRQLLQEKPAREGWLLVCQWLEKSWKQDPQHTQEVCLPYLHEHANDWPSSLRMAPISWSPQMIQGKLPYSFLSVVSALTISPFFADWDVYDAKDELFAWLEKMPKDCHALGGLHWSFADAVKDQKHIEWTYHHGDVVIALLQSPMCRALRVLDLSLLEFCSEPGKRGDEDVLGKVHLPDVAKGLQGSTLEVLLLHGQAMGTQMLIEQMTQADWQKLQHLKVLHVGGGLPIGNKQLQLFGKHLPALESLHILAGDSGQEYIFDDYEDFSDEETSYLRKWGVVESNWGDFFPTERGLNAVIKPGALKKIIAPKMRLRKKTKDLIKARTEDLASELLCDFHVPEGSEHLEPFRWDTYFQL